jgi:hypothetical protein
MVGKLSKYALCIIIIMVGISAVKKIAGKYNIPVISNLASEV